MNCGGCLFPGGSHKRWCPKVVGSIASMRGKQSEAIEQLADEIGANFPEVANALYRQAKVMLSAANTATIEHGLVEQRRPLLERNSKADG